MRESRMNDITRISKHLKIRFPRVTSVICYEVQNDHHGEVHESFYLYIHNVIEEDFETFKDLVLIPSAVS